MRGLKTVSLIILFSVFLVGLVAKPADARSAQPPLRPTPEPDKTYSENLATEWLNRAAEEAKRIKDVYCRDVFLWRLAETQAHARHRAMAMQTVQNIGDAAKRDLAYSGIAKAQARNGDFTGAKATAQHIQSNLRHYLDVLKTVAEEGGIDAAEAMARINKNWDFKAHANFYIAKAYAKHGNVPKAKALAGKIRHPSSSCKAVLQSLIYASIAEAQAKAGNFEQYEESLRLAKAFAKSVTVDQRANIYYQIVETQVGAHDFTGAKETANIISDSYYKSLAYKAIVTSLSSTGSITKAITVAESITTSNLKDSAYEVILKAQIESGDIDGAAATAQHITREQNRSRALQEIAIARGDFKAAMDMASSLEKSDAKSAAYREIALAYAEIGNLAAYRKTIQRAINAAKAYKDPPPFTRSLGPRKPSLFNSIVRVQANVGDFEGAAATAALIPGGGEIRNLAIQHIAKLQFQAGRLADLQTWITSLPNPEDRTAAYLAAAEASIPDSAEKAQSKPRG